MRSPVHSCQARQWPRHVSQWHRILLWGLLSDHTHTHTLTSLDQFQFGVITWNRLLKSLQMVFFVSSWRVSHRNFLAFCKSKFLENLWLLHISCILRAMSSLESENSWVMWFENKFCAMLREVQRDLPCVLQEKHVTNSVIKLCYQIKRILKIFGFNYVYN